MVELSDLTPCQDIMSSLLNRLTKHHNLEIGQLLLHSECGVCKFSGVQTFESFSGTKPLIVVEFAGKACKRLSIAEIGKLQVIDTSKTGRAEIQLDTLGTEPKCWKLFLQQNQVAANDRPLPVETSKRITRRPLQEKIRHEVWRRDGGVCVRCGSRERLEFDHIVPVVRGGSDTVRNLELLCESCNRKKSASV